MPITEIIHNFAGLTNMAANDSTSSAAAINISTRDVSPKNQFLDIMTSYC